MKIISILIIFMFTSLSSFAQNSDNSVILTNAISSVSLSNVSIAALQIPIMSSSVLGGSVVSLVKAGVASTSVAGIAVASSAGAGYFFGKMIVTIDQVHLDGILVDSVGKVLSPAFYTAYKVQSYLEK